MPLASGPNPILVRVSLALAPPPLPPVALAALLATPLPPVAPRRRVAALTMEDIEDIKAAGVVDSTYIDSMRRMFRKNEIHVHQFVRAMDKQRGQSWQLCSSAFESVRGPPLLWLCTLPRWFTVLLSRRVVCVTPVAIVDAGGAGHC